MSHRSRALISAVFAAGAAAALLVAPTPALGATAVPTCALKLTLPSKIAIRSSSQSFVVSAGGCTSLDAFFAGVDLIRSGSRVEDSFFFSETDRHDNITNITAAAHYWTHLSDASGYRSGTCDDHDGLGPYPCLVDYDITLTRTSLDARYYSHISARATRSGRHLKFSLQTTGFSPSADFGLGAVVGRSAEVQLQRLSSSGKWTYLKTLTTDSHGKLSWTAYAPARHRYRAVYLATSTVWSSTTTSFAV